MLSSCTCHLRTTLPRQIRRYASSIASTSKVKLDDRLYKSVIGLELHVQLKGNLKLLSPTLATYDAEPNSQVSVHDAALPGSLPRLGKEPVRLALLASLAFKSDIHETSTFDRKHYFYPDLPAGFQVTQKYSPLATGGIVKVKKPNSSDYFQVRIEQIQLEQDTAKSSHDPTTGLTLINLNRAGAALIEIVTRPDMSSAEEAAAFVRKLQSILRHVGVSDANMDKGEMRIDVNVSVQKNVEGSALGTRCEVKNLNGVKFLMAAIKSEIKQQIIELEAGRVVEQATRGFNAITSETFFLRGKADAPDYRYMPDPELGEIKTTPAQIKELSASLPELPDEAFDRLISQYSLSDRDAAILVALGEGSSEEGSDSDNDSSQNAGLGVEYFEIVANGREGRVAANWVINELLGQLAKAKINFPSTPVSAVELGALIDAVVDKKITGTVAKSLLKQSLITPFIPLSELVKSAVISGAAPVDSIESQSLIESVILDFPKEVEKIQSGQMKVLMRLVGEVMKRSKGTADAVKTREDLIKRIMK